MNPKQNKNSKNLKTTATITAIFVAIVFCLPYFASAAYKIEQIGVSGAANKDFVVGPGKVELEMNPGESKTTAITVTNRMGSTRTFSLEVQDFTGSREPSEVVVILENERGPYSLKDFLKFETKTFELKEGERATIPVTVTLPTDAEPGGRFGTVLVSTVAKEGVASQSSAIVTRLGVLFFVKIPGEVKNDGELIGFKTAGDKSIFGQGPITFRLLYENNGSVYVNPYGEIKIKNLLGEEVGSVIAEPWFAMPQSLRLREVSWNRPFLFGRYTAVASINRGYENIVDTKTLSFWVIPWKIVLAVFVSVFVLILCIRFVVTRFELKRKS